jgi:glyoxylase-like metal-dependent hydrolase (beta-lactamase superfamily II)
MTPVRELQRGLWHWTAPHPEWTPDHSWPQDVSSYAIDDGSRLLLFDPLDVPGELLELAADREPVVVLTAPWHERGTQSLVERLGVVVFAPAPDTADDLVRKYGISREQIPKDWQSPDLAWLATTAGEAHLYAAGEQLPIGIEAFPGRAHNDVVLWIEERRALVTGDALVDFGRGFEIPQEVLQHGVTREEVAKTLSPLLALPIDVVLPTHGAPQDRAALERALA